MFNDHGGFHQGLNQIMSLVMHAAIIGGDEYYQIMAPCFLGSTLLGSSGKKKPKQVDQVTIFRPASSTFNARSIDRAQPAHSRPLRKVVDNAQNKGGICQTSYIFYILFFFY
jgi:hypothetical protein